jgi:hypothetical protein
MTVGFMNTGHDPVPDRLARAEYRLRHPRPGSRVELAQKFGVDLTLSIEKLRLFPEERVLRMHDAANAAEQVRGAARPKRT